MKRSFKVWSTSHDPAPVVQEDGSAAALMEHVSPHMSCSPHARLSDVCIRPVLEVRASGSSSF